MVPADSGFNMYTGHIASNGYLYIVGYRENGSLICNTPIVFNSSSFFTSILDIEGDGNPEIIFPTSPNRVLILRSNGEVVPFEPVNGQSTTFSNIVGYRPPGHQTNWFFAMQSPSHAPSSFDTTFIYGYEGMNLLPGFPFVYPRDLALPNGPVDLTLYGPENDTLYLMLQDSFERFTLFTLPMTGGGVMECQTALQDFDRTGIYAPRHLTSINEPHLRGMLPIRRTIHPFPNPSNGLLHIRMDGYFQGPLTLFSIDGRLIANLGFVGSSGRIQNLTYNWSDQCASGLYYLCTSDGSSAVVMHLK